MTKLPSGHRRIMSLVTRSAPTMARPRLRTEFEDQLRAADIEHAAVYASMEDLAEKLDQLAETIREEDTAVPLHVNEDEDDSLVVRVDEALRRRH